jgi:hypothetical protein
VHFQRFRVRLSVNEHISLTWPTLARELPFCHCSTICLRQSSVRYTTSRGFAELYIKWRFSRTGRSTYYADKRMCKSISSLMTELRRHLYLVFIHPKIIRKARWCNCQLFHVTVIVPDWIYSTGTQSITAGPAGLHEAVGFFSRAPIPLFTNCAPHIIKCTPTHRSNTTIVTPTKQTQPHSRALGTEMVHRESSKIIPIVKCSTPRAKSPYTIDTGRTQDITAGIARVQVTVGILLPCLLVTPKPVFTESATHIIKCMR